MLIEAIIPVRSFDGLTRLSPIMEPESRAAMMRRLVDRTVSASRAAGITPVIVTGDAAVADWAVENGVRVVDEEASGLDAAAATGIAAATGEAWLVIHADLPAVTPTDIAAAAGLLDRGVVLAPSHDGGTSVIGGTDTTFPFRYGPGSFKLHLSAVGGDASILVRPGLAIDLDRPWDLDTLKELGWL
ncbi:MAG: 2-phospho-L-lactate guanylyltransferase [Actinomycetota bacterium]